MIMFSATIATLVLTSEFQFQPETRIVIAQRLAQNLKYTQSSNDRIILTILIDMTQDEETGQSIIEILVGIGIVKKLCESLLTWLQQRCLRRWSNRYACLPTSQLQQKL
jgi:hypothetical protein